MACGSHGGSSGSENCVCNVLRAIVEAQNQISPLEEFCETSCERSIQQLVGGVQAANEFDTIPVILYCGCDPFLGFGVGPSEQGNQKQRCVATFYFRVVDVDNNCCATLELLESGMGEGNNIPQNPCQQLMQGGGEGSFTGTGICITMDLSCFCGVTCLNPVALM